MSMILKNASNYYINISLSGGVKITDNKDDATIFNDVEVIKKLKHKAPSKLRSYSIIDLDTDELINIKDINTKISRKSFGKTTRQTIYHNSACTCQICGKSITFEEFTIDHIIPLAKGGTNDMSNLQSSCFRCNRIKADILPDDFNETIQNIILYRMHNNYDKSFAKSIIKIYLKNIFKKYWQMKINNVKWN